MFNFGQNLLLTVMYSYIMLMIMFNDYVNDYVNKLRCEHAYCIAYNKELMILASTVTYVRSFSCPEHYKLATRMGSQTVFLLVEIIVSFIAFVQLSFRWICCTKTDITRVLLGVLLLLTDECSAHVHVVHSTIRRALTHNNSGELSRLYDNRSARVKGHASTGTRWRRPRATSETSALTTNLRSRLAIIRRELTCSSWQTI